MSEYDLDAFKALHNGFLVKKIKATSLECENCSTPENPVLLDDYEGSNMVCPKCDALQKVSKDDTSFRERTYKPMNKRLKYIPVGVEVDKAVQIQKDMEKLVRLNVDNIIGESPIALHNVFRKAARMAHTILEVRLQIVDAGNVKQSTGDEKVVKKKGSNRANRRRGIYAVCFGIALYARNIFKTKKELCSYFGIEEKYYSSGKSIMHSALGLQYEEGERDVEVDAFLSKYFELIKIDSQYIDAVKTLYARMVANKLDDTQSLQNTLFDCLYSTCLILKLKTEAQLLTVIESNKTTKLRSYHKKFVHYKKCEFQDIYNEWATLYDKELCFDLPANRKKAAAKAKKEVEKVMKKPRVKKTA